MFPDIGTVVWHATGGDHATAGEALPVLSADHAPSG